MSILQSTLREFRKCQSGAAIILVGVIFLVLVGAVAIVVDVGRIYAVHSKAQNAADAALLGAVATMSTTDLNSEVTRLFNANYPTDYMGSVVKNMAVAEVSSGVYEMTFDVDLSTIMVQSVFSENMMHLQILSQVTRGFEEQRSKQLELALVLDNTASMGSPMSKMEGLKHAARDLVDIIFAEQATSTKIHISVVPYSTVVNIGPQRADWMQDPGAFDTESRYYGMNMYQYAVNKWNKGLAANRQWDHWCGPKPIYGCNPAHTCPSPDPCNAQTQTCQTTYYDYTDPETGQVSQRSSQSCSCYPCVPSAAKCTAFPGPPLTWNTWGGRGNICPPMPDSGTVWYEGGDDSGRRFNDISDAPPTTRATKFRLYYDNAPFFAIVNRSDNNNYTSYIRSCRLPQIMFASNDKADVKSLINSMTPTGDTRIPVGLMWGWFTLSPKWQGTWDAGKPGLPANFQPSRLDKALVLMTDGKNVRTPSAGTYRGLEQSVGDDDYKTDQLCAAIKAQGITIYTVGYGDEWINEDVLRRCASVPGYYFKAATADDLATVFHKIADDILFNTLRLSK